MMFKPVAFFALAFALLAPLFVPIRAAAQAPAHLEMYVFGGSQHIHGPDGQAHDTMAPSSVVLKAGIPVTVTVENYTSDPHTVTAPGLHVDVIINPGTLRKDHTVAPVTTTFTFTPKQRGNFRWYCKVPCDGAHGYWAMGPGYGGPGKEGFMAGEFIVI